MSSPPTVLILGGLAGDSTRLLLAHLLPPPSASDSTNSGCSFLRIVDKYLLMPGNDIYNTYIDSGAREALKRGLASGILEYNQGNLLSDATREKAFKLPEKFGNKGFDYVFDFTGETTSDPSDIVFVERTLRLSLLCGQTAALSNVGIHVRLLSEFYKTSNGVTGRMGEVGGVETECWGRRAGWIQESARGLALIKGLNLVCVRPAILYGRGVVNGLTTRVLIGELYRFKTEKMDLLWSESLAQSTIHATDFCSALLAIASYSLTSPSSLTALLESLPSTLTPNDLISPLLGIGAAKKEVEIKVPVFTIVDEGSTTQKEIARMVEEVVGVKVGFYGSLVSGLARLNLSGASEDANDKHSEIWSELLSTTPISPLTPLSPLISIDQLSSHPIDFSPKILMEMTGWKPVYKTLSIQAVREGVEGLRAEGNWPSK